ncbi:MAG: fibronectin type III domain-containing protein [Bacteroidales bacterium]|nr:fibronectin type III domain-containing protein [Bacteroidales bacterium]
MLLAALLAMPIGVHAATDSLTVASGTATNAYVPIYGNYSDVVQHNQMIYPASMLTSMVGQNIYGLKFFIGGNWTVTQATISLAVVADTTLLQLDTTTTLTPVWSGPLSHGIDVQFAAAFAYTGGSLLVDIQTLGGGSYSNSSAQGIARSGAARYGYDFFGFSESACDFLPKACFYYTDGDFCSAPSAPAMVSSTGEALTFSWSPGGTEIEWEAMVGDSIATSILDTFVTVYGLTPSTQYPVKVRAVCGVGDTSNWSSEVMMTTQCGAIENLPWTHGFEGVAAGDIPVCWTRTPIVYNNILGGGTTNYSQFLISRELSGTDMLLSFQYAKQNTSLERLRVGYSATDRDTNSFAWQPWIADTSISYTQWRQYTDSIPEGTRFVAIQYASPRYFYAYIDNLTITGSAACLSPVVGDIVRGEDNLTISYSAEVDSVEVIVSAGGFNPNEPSVVVTASLYVATGLNHSTEYFIAMRSLCEGGHYSEWTVVTDSTLTIDCVPPANLTVVSTTFNSVELGWTVQGNESLWEVEAYNTLGSAIQTAATNPYTFTGLTSGMTYNLRVRALCGQNSNLPGDWSDVVQATPDECPGVTGVSVGDTTETSAKVSWQPVQGSLGYKVYYGIADFEDAEATVVDVATTATDYTMSGLTPGSNYEVYVLNRCTETLYSNVTTDDRVAFTTLGVNGIYDVENGTLTLFPNPASDKVTVAVAGFEGEVGVEIVDMNGRCVAGYTTKDSELTVNVGDLSQGAYFVRVTGATHTAVRKLIVK